MKIRAQIGMVTQDTSLLHRSVADNIRYARPDASDDEVIAANPDVADKIRTGKVQAAGALIGQVMKAMKGQADAGKVRELVLSKLA